MYVCMYVYIYIYVYVYLNIYMYRHIFVYIFDWGHAARPRTQKSDLMNYIIVGESIIEFPHEQLFVRAQVPGQGRDAADEYKHAFESQSPEVLNGISIILRKQLQITDTQRFR